MFEDRIYLLGQKCDPGSVDLPTVKRRPDEITAREDVPRPSPGGPPSRLRLVMIVGPDLGRRIDLREGETRFGREPSCQVVLPLGGVSRAHCTIRCDATGVGPRDLGSTNGTRRNGLAAARTFRGWVGTR